MSGLRICVLLASVAQILMGIISVVGQAVQASQGASNPLSFCIAFGLIIAGIAGIFAQSPKHSTTGLRVTLCVIDSLFAVLFMFGAVFLIAAASGSLGGRIQINEGMLAIVGVFLAAFILVCLFNAIAIPMLGKQFNKLKAVYPYGDPYQQGYAGYQPGMAPPPTYGEPQNPYPPAGAPYGQTGYGQSPPPHAQDPTAPPPSYPTPPTYPDDESLPPNP